MRRYNITGVPTDTTPASVVAVNINLPLWNCLVVSTPAPCPDLSCQEQKQVDLLTAAIAAGTSAVNGQIASQTTTISGQIAPVARSVRDTLRLVKNVGNDVDDLADDIGDLADDVADL